MAQCMFQVQLASHFNLVSMAFEINIDGVNELKKKKNERVVNLIKSPDRFLHGWFSQNVYPLSKEEVNFRQSSITR